MQKVSQIESWKFLKQCGLAYDRDGKYSFVYGLSIMKKIIFFRLDPSFLSQYDSGAATEMWFWIECHNKPIKMKCFGEGKSINNNNMPSRNIILTCNKYLKQNTFGYIVPTDDNSITLI